MKENTKKQPTARQQRVDEVITQVLAGDKMYMFASAVAKDFGLSYCEVKRHARYKELRAYLDQNCEAIIDDADAVLIQRLNSEDVTERTIEVAYRRFGDIELRKKMNGVIVDVAIQQQQDEFGALARTFFGAPDKEADK